MTMSTRPQPSPFPSVKAIASWLINLATWFVARSLQMPEPLVYSTGVYVFAQVQAVETRAARTLCPVRLVRRLRQLLR